MKELLRCENSECGFITKSEQLLRKHQSAEHPELRKKRGRPPLAKKKTRSEINRDYRDNLAQKARSKSTETTRTEATVPASKKPKAPASKKPKAPPKIPYTAAEPSDVIGMFHWLPPLNEDEALHNMKCPKFWRECCENGLDPLWAYRYLRWRLGRPSLTEWRLFNTIPGP